MTKEIQHRIKHKSNSHCSKKSHSTKSHCSKKSHSTKSHSSECKSRKFHNKRSHKEKTIKGKSQKVIHERIVTLNEIDKVYIQPIVKTKRTKKTIVVILPTKYIKAGCKDLGVKILNKHKSNSKSECKSDINSSDICSSDSKSIRYYKSHGN